ncbi:carboxypeptidase M32 [Natronorubrum sp. JWXQ-INN-674]|uniref:Metal-dependent carboxypeptidase n=1 Tax=Natronorubrum halalkaliphilum TaxID=2691917 RepID=A0A6B0VR22_9EURY|nr:carboxypeptidase M32 [Natronorubrum halalkaliphilum]MXV63775.1 carboxypeptidase M32 [Natronorubrum halalkaliphilum]
MTGETTTDPPAAYDALIDRYGRLTNLQYASMYLNWDQQVMMPEGGSPGRSRQLSAISATRHDLLVDDDVARWLDALEDASLTDRQAAAVREIRREHDRAANVPSELVEDIARTAAENQRIWQEAKADDDFETFAPRLERIRDLQRKQAEHIDPETPPYEVMYEESHPFLPIGTMEDIFETLRSEIPPLVEEIRASGTNLADPFDGEYPDADQRALSEAALDYLGYDRSRGRLDTAPHPFMAGNQFDARVTTRFKPTDPMDALTATIHELGHATYQLGLPKDEYGSPLGNSRMSIHESQSRFWENHVGRTEPFWEGFLPELTDHLEGHDDLTVREAFEAANRIRPENRIRVEADELTYHMHIILRCEIDRAFVEGDLAVEEIPAVWNEKMDDYLGVRPDTDAEGCLQDIHWTSRFACFQSYTLGSVVAAQLDAAVRDDLDVDGLVREGEFEPIHDWMTEHVHRHGQRYETPELIERATGEPLTADYFVEYAREKFERLYDL